VENEGRWGERLALEGQKQQGQQQQQKQQGQQQQQEEEEEATLHAPLVVTAEE
jgi:hypothetical protein